MKIRQQAPTIDGIREDHVNRYKFAISMIESSLEPVKPRILDVGCGVGYGAKMMAEAFEGCKVHAFDADSSAIDYAKAHYLHENVVYSVERLENVDLLLDYDFVTMFEIIEHTSKAPEFLERASHYASYLVGSVPNENVVPFIPGKVNAEHYRHYTPLEIREELENTGWKVVIMAGQGKRGEQARVNVQHVNDRTIVFFAKSKNLCE